MDTSKLRQQLKSLKSDTWLSVVCAALVCLGLGATFISLQKDATVKPIVAFDRSEWLVSFEITQGCDGTTKASPECPANPLTKTLWASQTKRDSESFLKRYKSENGSAFWMGLKVSSDQLKTADKSGATTFVLPKLNGSVQVWLDGVYQMTHDFSQQRMPLQISIPRSRLQNGKELAIALSVFPYPHQPVPEKNQDVKEGFFNPLAADELSQSEVFLSSSQNLIAVALFLLVGIFLWSVSSTGRTRDYAVGTQLALLVALTTLLSADLSFQIFSVARYESIFFSLLLLEGVIIARLTWTLLKGSRSTSLLESAGLLACLLVPNIFSFYGWIESTGVNLVTAWVLPLVYLGSALALGSRLHKIGFGGSKTRWHFLVLTIVSLALTGAAYVFESYHQSGFHVVYSRWLNLIVLFGLVHVFTKSHQTKSSLIELSPLSSYHRLETLPETVPGWVLQLDVLKFSRDRQVLSTVISHLWTIAKLHDAEIVKANESSITVLFTNEDSVSQTLKEMAKCVRDLERRLPIVLTEKASIVFRAAVVKGSLKPAWNTGENGLSKIPAWHESDDTFATLTKLHADLSLPNDRSVVLGEVALDLPSDLSFYKRVG